MKIGIDIRSTLKTKTGIGYYTLNLVNSIAGVDSDNSYYLYSYIRPFDLKRKVPRLPGNNFKHRIDRFRFRPDIKMSDADVFHTSSYDAPDFKSGRTKLVSTIHDIIPLVYREGYPEEVLENLENKVRATLKRSDLVVVDSINTRRDLEEKFSHHAGKIRVAYPGRDESFSPITDKEKIRECIKQKYGISKEFILFIGTIEKRKNVKGLIQAFCELKRERKIPHSLVIIGKKGWGGEPALDLLQSLGEFKNEICLPGYIKREDLVLFYNAAELFVYPSFYEGFGFPILEAFSCGVPVITSSTTSCGEIAGDGAYTLVPGDIAALKEAICTVLYDKATRDDLKSKGFNRARMFSWENTAREFVDIFGQITKR